MVAFFATVGLEVGVAVTVGTGVGVGAGVAVSDGVGVGVGVGAAWTRIARIVGDENSKLEAFIWIQPLFSLIANDAT